LTLAKASFVTAKTVRTILTERKMNKAPE
jgi:hypothetical protein